jgi:uncharacterized protein (TIGR02246 family)
MRSLALAALSLALLVTACQPATTQLTEEQKAAIEEEVRQTADDLNDAWIARDFDRFRSFFADDLRWAMSPMPFATMEEIEPGVRAYVSGISEITLEDEDSFIRVLGPDAAVVGSTSHETVVDVNGVSSSVRTAGTFVWARVDGVWKVVHGHQHPITE